MDIKRYIEVDIDGVVADMYTALDKEIEKDFPSLRDIHLDKILTSWGMEELDFYDKNLRKYIFNKFSDAKFIRDLPLYGGVIEGLIYLSEYAKEKGMTMIFNTQVFNEKCKKAREIWIKEEILSKGIEAEILIQVGKDKEMLENTYILVEDNPNNLCKSTADIKFLVRRGHNRYYTERMIRPIKESYVITNLKDIKNMQVLSNERTNYKMDK